MPLYQLFKIDMLDSYPLADILNDEKYALIKDSDDLVQILKMALGGFNTENPNIKSYSQWVSEAENGGYEFIIITHGQEIFRASEALLSQSVLNSILLMLKHHAGAIRKGDGHPYLEHTLEVGKMLAKNKLSPDVIAAGYGHDLLEDTKCSELVIRDQCGDEVLRIIKAVSNDESLSDKKDWELKKEKYVKSVEAGGVDAIAVSVADKICNLHSFFRQYEVEGVSLWSKFNRGKDKKVWFEKLVLEMAKKHWNHQLVFELESLVVKLEKLP